jgi:hypothetical protein
VSERLLSVDVTGPDGDVEAEQVLLRADAEAVELQLDDGTLMTFDAQELATALSEHEIVHKAA